jgi:hypothetical protein
VPDYRAGRDLCPGCHPLVVRLELQAKRVVEDPQAAVVAARDRLWHHRLDFLRHHADIDLAAAVVAEAIEAEAVVEVAEQRDVVLERDVG